MSRRGRGYQPCRSSAILFAAGSAAAAAAILLAYTSPRKSRHDGTRARGCHEITQAGSTATQIIMHHRPLMPAAPRSLVSNPYRRPWFAPAAAARCEATGANHSNEGSAVNGCNSNKKDESAGDASVMNGNRNNDVNIIDYYYTRLDPKDIERTSLLDSHAVFGALWGEGLIERYDVYRRVNRMEDQHNKEQQQQQLLHQKQNMACNKRELTVVDIKLGSRLNGHGGIVHGGIISLLFDEAMGWAYECLQAEQEGCRNSNDDDDDDDDSTTTTTSTTAVTANLTVNFRAPFFEGSEAVVRVYHDETKGRKMYFSATLESKDGGVIFAQARSLFILVRSDRLNKK